MKLLIIICFLIYVIQVIYNERYYFKDLLIVLIGIIFLLILLELFSPVLDPIIHFCSYIEDAFYIPASFSFNLLFIAAFLLLVTFEKMCRIILALKKINLNIDNELRELSLNHDYIDYHNMCSCCGKELIESPPTLGSYLLCNSCKDLLIKHPNTFDEITTLKLHDELYARYCEYNSIIESINSCTSLINTSILRHFKHFKSKLHCLENARFKCWNNKDIVYHEMIILRAILDYGIPYLQREYRENLEAERELARKQMAIYHKIQEKKIAQQKAIQEEQLKFKKQKMLDKSQEKEKQILEITHTISNAQYSPERFAILKNSFHSKNAIDNYVRAELSPLIINYFGNRCLKCGDSFDLVLAPYWLSKNHGGNLIMKEIESRNLINNTVVLCGKCAHFKTNHDYKDYFDYKQQKEFDDISLSLSKYYNEDFRTISKCNSVYASYFSKSKKLL